jgi:hypothetical protein
MAICYENWNEPLIFGDYLSCMIKNLFGVAQIIFIALAIIIVMYLIYRVFTNRDNATVLEEIGKHWIYVALLVVVAIGGAGTFINILLKFFGFEGFDYWLQQINTLLGVL